MSRRMFKYPLDLTDGDQIIKTHGDAVARHVAMQNGTLCVWIECEPGEPETEKRFRVHGTGHPIEDGYSWRGTTEDRQFVWHVYERNF